MSKTDYDFCSSLRAAAEDIRQNGMTRDCPGDDCIYVKLARQGLWSVEYLPRIAENLVGRKHLDEFPPADKCYAKTARQSKDPGYKLANFGNNPRVTLQEVMDLFERTARRIEQGYIIAHATQFTRR